MLKVAMSGPERVVAVSTTALGKRGGAARWVCDASNFDERCKFGLSSLTCSMLITTPTLPATVGSTSGFFVPARLELAAVRTTATTSGAHGFHIARIANS